MTPGAPARVVVDLRPASRDDSASAVYRSFGGGDDPEPARGVLPPRGDRVCPDARGRGRHPALGRGRAGGHAGRPRPTGWRPGGLLSATIQDGAYGERRVVGGRRLRPGHRGRSQDSRRPGKQSDDHDPRGEIHLGDQGFDEWDLETIFAPPDHEPVLGPAQDHVDDLAHLLATPLLHLEPDKILGQNRRHQGGGGRRGRR